MVSFIFSSRVRIRVGIGNRVRIRVGIGNTVRVQVRVRSGK